MIVYYKFFIFKYKQQLLWFRNSKPQEFYIILRLELHIFPSSTNMIRIIQYNSARRDADMSYIKEKSRPTTFSRIFSRIALTR